MLASVSWSFLYTLVPRLPPTSRATPIERENLLLLLLVFGCATWLDRSLFLNQGSKSSLQWKCRTAATEPPGNFREKTLLTKVPRKVGGLSLVQPEAFQTNHFGQKGVMLSSIRPGTCSLLNPGDGRSLPEPHGLNGKGLAPQQKIRVLLPGEDGMDAGQTKRTNKDLAPSQLASELLLKVKVYWSQKRP